MNLRILVSPHSFPRIDRVRSPRSYQWLAQFERTRVRYAAIALGILFVLPSAFSGFAMDDYILLYQLAHRAGSEWAGSSPFDLFRWVEPHAAQRLIDGGGLAWWSYPQIQIAFLRPVTSLTHALDAALWPRNAVLMHLHSIAWLLVLMVLVERTYGRLIENRWTAGVATAMFALDSAHGLTVGWIANRNALIAAVFGVAALLCHHRARSGERRLYPVAWLCLGLSLFAGELGVGSLGYLLAYALCYETGSLSRRLRSLLPYAVPVLGWAFVRSAAHYGVHGLGAYVDPVAEPLAFLRALPGRVLVLLNSQITRLGADLYDVVPSAMQRPFLLVAGAALAATGWLVWPSLRAVRSLRALGLGAVLSAIPLVAGAPSDRLLTLVGVGAFPVLAHAAGAALRSVRLGERGQGLRAGLSRVLLGVHLVLDPLLLPALALWPAVIAEHAQAAERSLPDAPEVAQQTVLVAQVPDSVLLTYLPVMRWFDRRPRPDHLHWLLATTQSAHVERLSDRELRVTCEGGCFDRHWNERSSRLPLHRGDRVVLRDMTVAVLEVAPDGRPVVCDFSFNEPLEAARYRWLTWRHGRLEAWQVPEPGQSSLLAGGE
jgi:hypothetical protein